jgi:DNA-3-methyladenine glycosylase
LAGRAWQRLGREFFVGDARDVGRALIGKVLAREDGRAARLVEVEAYLGMDDPGSHAFRGPTPRTSIMFGPAGHLYVYFSYGMHWCANVVCGPDGKASAVLLRAGEPLQGVELMRRARSNGQRAVPDRDLCRGPARLAEAFGITGEDNGLDVAPDGGSPALLWFADAGTEPPGRVISTRRVGLSSLRGAELPWRYVLQGSPWLSPGPRQPRP